MARRRRCSTGDNLDIKMDFDTLGKLGSMLGSGAVIVIMNDPNLHPLRGAADRRVLQPRILWQCTPCREGTMWMVKLLRRITAGDALSRDIDQLERIGKTIGFGPPNITLCALGDASTSCVTSGIRLFREEFEYHARTGTVHDRSSTGRGVCSPVTIGPGVTVDNLVKSYHQRPGIHRPEGHEPGRRGEVGRDRHPDLLLSPEDEAGRRVPHVSRRDRKGAQASDCLHDDGCRRHDRQHEVGEGGCRSERGDRVPAREPSTGLPSVR